MKLGARLTLYLSLIIILILVGYGYFHVLSRRDTLNRMMRLEVRSIGEILRVSLEKISLPREMVYVQELLDAVSEPERTLGVVFYYLERDLTFRSQSLEGDVAFFLERIKFCLREGRAREDFGVYKKVPVFSYTFPLKDKGGKTIGGVSVVQNASFLHEDIQRAKETIFLTIIILIGGTIISVLFITRRWLTLPIHQLMEGIQRMAKGQLGTRIGLERGDEISKLAQAFNQMASDLQEAQQKVIRETESKLELERNLRRSEKLATIGQLASELAHEIGTPLNIIGGRAELSQKRLEDKEAIKKNLNIIAGQTEKITKIIQHLLGFVRKKKPEKTSLNVHSVLDITLDFLDQKIEKQKVRVERNLMADPPSVQGDPDQLQQVFLNLFLNALQALPGGGTLRLSTSSNWITRGGLGDRSRRYLEVAVEDTGTGMGKEVMENIFQPFFTTKTEERGTGLGLTVSQGIIQEHDGWIEVESEVGKGSSFKIYLPAMKSNPPEGRKGLSSGEERRELR